MSIGENIEKYRTLLGLTQRELGEKLSVSNQAVSKWENGVSLPDVMLIPKIAEVFGISIYDLYDGKKPAESRDKRISGKTGKMKSIRYIYKIGYGPSSSHTMGPAKACESFRKQNPDADYYKIILYGSLAKTGKGHGTDAVIRKIFFDKAVEIIFDTAMQDIPHPNTMDMYAYENNTEVSFKRAISVGGGSVVIEGENTCYEEDSDSLKSFREISDFCRKNDIELWDYIDSTEHELLEYLLEVWDAMKQSIKRGLNDSGELPGGLGVKKKAKQLYSQRHINESAETKENRLVCSYAFAVSEQNASGEKIVTAPTCGSCGVVAAVMYYFQKRNNYSDTEIAKALGVAGLFGNLVKYNASISGAECGCQAEIGTACAMAAAGLGQLFGLRIDQIEYAAEIAIEHHLGLTCDPIKGLVQIPCIERNAVAAMRAINAVSIADFLSDSRKISFDTVVDTMYETGINISKEYRETSEAGLAKIEVRSFLSE